MPRVFMIIAGVVLAVLIWLFYQNSVEQKQQADLQEYETVLEEKTGSILQQAQDWSKPIQIDLEDDRLDGDYAVMAQFILGQMRDRAEARNQYLRDLKAANWDRFLDIDRLAKDQAQDYKETEAMLKRVHEIVDGYEQTIQQRATQQLEQVKQLDIKNRYRQQLADNLKANQQQDNAHAIFEIEKQSLAKADQLFLVLKNNKWEKKNQTFMFYEDAPLKQFNKLYQEIVQLNQQMTQVDQQALKEAENKL